jgi:Lrp/AsnC family transcriptional regulator
MTDTAVQVLEPNRRLDAIDRKILTVLQDDASLSVAEIGDRVGLSSTPCWKRIQRLEADGVILRRVALVDQNKIGLGISVFVSVESSDHSEAWLKKFAEAVSAMPEVMEFYRMAGDVDYMLRVVVADMQSYDVFYKKHLALCHGEDQIGHCAAGAGCAVRSSTERSDELRKRIERAFRRARGDSNSESLHIHAGFFIEN